MAVYRVNLIRIENLSIEVEAENEDDAVDAALDEAPRQHCAQCSGWGQKWSIDEGEWETLRDWYPDYDPKVHGETVVEEA